MAELKAELQERPSQEDARIVITHPWYSLTECQVDELQEKVLKYKFRKREWVRSSFSATTLLLSVSTAQRDSVTYLSTQLDKAESARENQEERSEQLQRVCLSTFRLFRQPTYRNVGNLGTSQEPQGHDAKER